MSRCTLGVGCDEAGVCYANAHGKPEQCGRWREFGVDFELPCAPMGWRLVWAAVWAALMRRPLLVTPAPMCLSLWIRAEGEVQLCSLSVRLKGPGDAHSAR